VPLNRFVALAFVEDTAAVEPMAVNVQFVQIKVPATALFMAVVPPPPLIVEFETVTVPVDELLTPKQAPPPPLIMQFDIVTDPVLEFVIGVPEFAPPVMVIKSQITDPLTLELVTPLPRLELGEIKFDPLIKRRLPVPLFVAARLCPPDGKVILQASNVIVPEPVLLTQCAFIGPTATILRFESVTEPPVTVKQ
jgi:hypothetical protein